MKSRSISLNESKLSDLESEEGIFDFNDNLATYVELLNKRINLKNYYGFPAEQRITALSRTFMVLSPYAKP